MAQAKAARTAGGDPLESRTQAIARNLWEQIEGRRPSVFERRWWDEHILEWAMADESVKVQMFRFVDVLPMLKSHESVTRHLQEYFEEVRAKLPWAVRLGLDASQANAIVGKLLALNARNNSARMAQRFIAGTRVNEVLQSVARLHKLGLGFTLDLLGEATISEPEADAYQRQYLQLIEGLAPQVNHWPEHPRIDSDDTGPIPRVNVSLKLSALTSRFRPIDPEGSAEAVKERLRPILRAAREHDVHVHVDMEQYSYKALTLRIFREVMAEDEFRDNPHVGIVIQVYQPEADRDLQGLLDWVQTRGTPIVVRLVKGAYWDYETINARQRGWSIPVYQKKPQSDAAFERLSNVLFENHRWLRPALGSHNLRSLAHGIALAEKHRVPQSAWEIQMLYGMADNQAQLFAEQGFRVRIYTPFGEMLPGMAYLVRRLLENTSNDSFLRHTYDRSLVLDKLLGKPTAE
jgi:RHH-type transcriptional regulator, proline utilization regulon repressor / proline dehydrogenase / delta 1-pyrroline-5-carboxylate dehydrogenase